MLEKKKRKKKNNPRTFYRYSECFKEQVVREVSQGSSISEGCRRYDIKNMSIVSKWIRQYGRHELLNTVIRVKMRSEDDRVKQLEAEIKRLKISLADAVLAKELLETLVEMVDNHYQTDVKKNFGQELSLDVRVSKTKK